MPASAEGPADEWYVTQRWGVGTSWDDDGDAGGDGDGGAAWIAHPDEGMQRGSAALAVDGDVWVVDPVDTPELDTMLEELGEVRGVVVLLDRHYRDADDVAGRHDVPVYVPDIFDGLPEMDADVERFGDRLPDTDYRARTVVDNRFWTEVALFDGETLVVPEALGTTAYTAPGDERLGVHPILRLRPPRSQFSGLGPERILVGHGEGVDEDATAALESALSTARRNAPRAFGRMVAGLIRG
jgi:hypothetical protein